MTVALYAGSFDPMHNGHLCIVAKSARMFDEVVVAVLSNPAKRSGLLAGTERRRLAVASVAMFDNVRVVSSDGLTIDVARTVGADVLVRSAHKERRGEGAMAAVNRRAGAIPTVFLDPDADVADLSSSAVRDLLAAGRLDDVRGMVPPVVAQTLIERRRPQPTNRSSQATATWP